MSTLAQELAQEVVAAFLAELDPGAAARLEEADLERLELLVREAISASAHDTAERLEQLAQTLRNEEHSPEIEC
jgi:hypothetical protein